MVVAGGLAQAMMLPLIGLGAIYLRHAHLPPTSAGGLGDRLPLDLDGADDCGCGLLHMDETELAGSGVPGFRGSEVRVRGIRVVITGGAGFLGSRLADALIARGTLRGPDGSARDIEQIVLVDSAPPHPLADSRVVPVTGDIASGELFDRLIDTSITSIFHLAAVVSGQAELDFDLGMRTNVDATRALLEVCRARGHAPRVVFASSVAVFGGDMPPAVSEATALTPQTSYGMEKAIGELLLNDYSRRGFVDGRALRLPTISVRPGRPNAAASGFASSIIREPLNGESVVCPVDPDARIVIASPATAIGCFIAAHELPAGALGSNRTVNVPGISVTAGELVAALERVAGPDVVRRIKWQKDDRVARMVTGWPQAVDSARAKALGFPGDENVDEIIRQYIEVQALPLK